MLPVAGVALCVCFARRLRLWRLRFAFGFVPRFAFSIENAVVSLFHATNQLPRVAAAAVVALLSSVNTSLVCIVCPLFPPATLFGGIPIHGQLLRIDSAPHGCCGVALFSWRKTSDHNDRAPLSVGVGVA